MGVDFLISELPIAFMILREKHILFNFSRKKVIQRLKRVKQLYKNSYAFYIFENPIGLKMISKMYLLMYVIIN